MSTYENESRLFLYIYICAVERSMRNEGGFEMIISLRVRVKGLVNLAWEAPGWRMRRMYDPDFLVSMYRRSTDDCTPLTERYMS